MQSNNENGKSWNSVSITQFELSKLVYTSGFFNCVNLTATSKLVLMALVQHYNANNADMFPSQKFLSKQLGISEKSVERSIANLKNENLIYYVTKKVNRYRFTAKFFELIKMSVKNRQNVGSHDRQNVGQTNKNEKINKKENFLNFSEVFCNLQENFEKQNNDLLQKINSNGAKAPQESGKNHTGLTKQEYNSYKSYGKNKKYSAAKNEIVSPCVHFANLTGRGEEIFMSEENNSDDLNGTKNVENAVNTSITNNADSVNTANKLVKNGKFKNSVRRDDLQGRDNGANDYNVSGKIAAFEDFKGNRKKGFSASQTSSAKAPFNQKSGESLKNALHTGNLDKADNSKWLSPLDFGFDDALQWVRALPISLKNSKFAQKLCEKYNFSQDEIYSDEQKEKLLQYSENDGSELDFTNEKFI